MGAPKLLKPGESERKIYCKNKSCNNHKCLGIAIIGEDYPPLGKRGIQFFCKVCKKITLI